MQMNKKYPSPYIEGKDEKAVGAATDIEQIKEESPEEKLIGSEQKLQK